MPKKLPTVSASMIVKNEADRIAKTLTALQPMVDEIIVFDTGSTDGTQVILQEFAAAHPGVVLLHQSTSAPRKQTTASHASTSAPPGISHAKPARWTGF